MLNIDNVRLARPGLGGRLLDQVRPDMHVIERAKIATRHRAIRFALDRIAKPFVRGPESVHDVPEMRSRCPTALSKAVTLWNRHHREEFFELVHMEVDDTPYGLDRQHRMVYFTIWCVMV